MDARFEALLSESTAKVNAGEIAAGIRLALSAQALAEAGQDMLASARALIAQAEAYFRLGQYAPAIQLSENAISLAREKEGSTDPDEKFTALHVMALAFHRLGCCAGETDSLGSPAGYFYQSIELARVVGEKRVQMRSLHSLSAGVYMPGGQFALALAIDEEAVRLAEDSANTDLLWGPYTTMSWVCLLSGDLERSAAYLEMLRREARPGTLAKGWEECISGHLEIAGGRIEQGRACFERMYANGERIGSPRRICPGAAPGLPAFAGCISGRGWPLLARSEGIRPG